MEPSTPLSDTGLEALWEKTLVVLHSLSNLRVSQQKINLQEGSPVLSGGYGDVQQARIRTFPFRSGALVAVKSLRLTGSREQRIRVIAAFARELRVWSKLGHRNILSLNGFYFDEKNLKTACLTAPWQSKGNVRTYLQSKKPDMDERLKLASDTARGLAYLHGLSPAIYHGDIKLENTLVDDDGNAMLCDFGLSKILDECASGLTTTKTPRYTIRYASPELLSETPTHTLTSDVWAWGCLLLAIVTDLLPYSKYKTDPRIMLAIAQHEAPGDTSGLSVPHAVKCLLSMCWMADPQSRVDMATCTLLLDPSLAISRLAIDHIPSAWTSSGDGWHAIHNLLSGNRCDIQFIVDLETDIVVDDFIFSPDGSSILVQKDATIVSYAVTTGAREMTIDLETFRPSAIGFDINGARLAAASLDDGIRVIDCLTTQTVARFSPVAGETYTSISFGDLDQYLVASASRGLRVHTLEDDGRQSVRSRYIQVTTPFGQIVTSPCHPICIAITSNSRGCVLSNLRTGSRGPDIKDVETAAFTPNGDSFIGGGAGDGLRMWDLRSTLEFQNGARRGFLGEGEWSRLSSKKLNGPQNQVSSVSVSSDGRLIASSSLKNGNICLWDIESTVLVMVGGDKLRGVSSVKFRPGSTASDGMIAIRVQGSHQEGSNLRVLQYNIRARDDTH